MKYQNQLSSTLPSYPRSIHLSSSMYTWNHRNLRLHQLMHFQRLFASGIKQFTRNAWTTPSRDWKFGAFKDGEPGTWWCVLKSSDVFDNFGGERWWHAASSSALRVDCCMIAIRNSHEPTGPSHRSHWLTQQVLFAQNCILVNSFASIRRRRLALAVVDHRGVVR